MPDGRGDDEISLQGYQDKLALTRLDENRWALPKNGHPSTHLLKADSRVHPGMVRIEATREPVSDATLGSVQVTHPEGEDPTAEFPSAPLRVRLFGALDLRLGEEVLAPLASTRARTLLGFLLLHDDAPHARRHLAFLLWPDSTEGQARTNLRNVLHTLRHASPEIDRLLEVTPRTLRWRRGPAGWIDVAAFVSAVGEADGAEVGSDHMVAALRTAVDLYVGDLLEGCYDEWVIEERGRFRDRYLSALRRLACALADRAEHAEAVRVGRELLRCDPLQEDTHRLLMRTHAAAGDRAAAVRVYHECVATLQRELGVEPSTPTRAAYAALMRADEATVAPDPGPVRISGAALVGRDREWAQLTRGWREAEEGRPRLVLVTGEPGVGKTRLVEELTAWCGHRSAIVAHSRSYSMEGELGYGTVISWLRNVDLSAQLRRAGPADLAMARSTAARNRSPNPLTCSSYQRAACSSSPSASTWTDTARFTRCAADQRSAHGQNPSPHPWLGPAGPHGRGARARPPTQQRRRPGCRQDRHTP